MVQPLCVFVEGRSFSFSVSLLLGRIDSAHWFDDHHSRFIFNSSYEIFLNALGVQLHEPFVLKSLCNDVSGRSVDKKYSSVRKTDLKISQDALKLRFVKDKWNSLHHQYLCDRHIEDLLTPRKKKFDLGKNEIICFPEPDKPRGLSYMPPTEWFTYIVLSEGGGSQEQKADPGNDPSSELPRATSPQNAEIQSGTTNEPNGNAELTPQSEERGIVETASSVHPSVTSLDIPEDYEDDLEGLHEYLISLEEELLLHNSWGARDEDALVEERALSDDGEDDGDHTQEYENKEQLLKEISLLLGNQLSDSFMMSMSSSQSNFSSTVKALSAEHNETQTISDATEGASAQSGDNEKPIPKERVRRSSYVKRSEAWKNKEDYDIRLDPTPQLNDKLESPPPTVIPTLYGQQEDTSHVQAEGVEIEEENGSALVQAPVESQATQVDGGDEELVGVGATSGSSNQSLHAHTKSFTEELLDIQDKMNKRPSLNKERLLALIRRRQDEEKSTVQSEKPGSQVIDLKDEIEDASDTQKAFKEKSTDERSVMQTGLQAAHDTEDVCDAEEPSAVPESAGPPDDFVECEAPVVRNNDHHSTEDLSPVKDGKATTLGKSYDMTHGAPDIDSGMTDLIKRRGEPVSPSDDRVLTKSGEGSSASAGDRYDRIGSRVKEPSDGLGSPQTIEAGKDSAPSISSTALQTIMEPLKQKAVQKLIQESPTVSQLTTRLQNLQAVTDMRNKLREMKVVQNSLRAGVDNVSAPGTINWLKEASSGVFSKTASVVKSIFRGNAGKGEPGPSKTQQHQKPKEASPEEDASVEDLSTNSWKQDEARDKLADSDNSSVEADGSFTVIAQQKPPLEMADQDAAHLASPGSTCPSHEVIPEESMGTVAFRQSHSITINDVFLFIFSLFDLFFWACLGIGIVIFEFCHCPGNNMHE